MTLDEQILLARDHGAKLHQCEDGLWSVLDQPGTLLWFAYFRDEATAAFAYCFQHGLALTPPEPRRSATESLPLMPISANLGTKKIGTDEISAGEPVGEPALKPLLDLTDKSVNQDPVTLVSSETALPLPLWSLLLRASQEDIMLIQAADGFRQLQERGLAVAESRDIGMREPTLCIALTEAGRTAMATFI